MRPVRSALLRDRGHGVLKGRGSLAVPVLVCVALVVVSPVRAALTGDANCDGVLTSADLPALGQRLFSPFDPLCQGADANHDSRTSAADFPSLIHILRPSGPRATFVGVASSGGIPSISLGTEEDGTPVYYRSAGFGFLLVVEAAAGTDRTRVGTDVFNSVPGDPAQQPDLQIQVDRDLGEGSRTVCDEFGVPAVDPVDFSPIPRVSDALNDFACRFQVFTVPGKACTQNLFGQDDFVAARTSAQFCLLVSRDLSFPDGDTVVRVRLRDVKGVPGVVQRLILRVGSGPMPPTFTPRPATATPSMTPTRTWTRTPTRTWTRTRTRTPTETRTQTRTPTWTVTRTHTRTPTVVRSTPTPTRTPTRIPSRTPTTRRTHTPTGTRGTSPTPTPVRTHTPTRTATRTWTPTRTRTPSRTRTPTRADTVTPPPTATWTRAPSATPSATPEQAQGPAISFFGVLRPDDTLTDPVAVDPNGIPIYQRPFGFGFSLVVEAKRGLSGAPVGSFAYDEFGDRPDLQIQVTRPLGNGSSAVCDVGPIVPPGGVPAIAPPSYGDNQLISDRLNDLGCRFLNGSGNPVARTCSDGCVRFITGEFGCVAERTSFQFCGLIARTLEFPPGDTLVTVRVLDTRGNPGPIRQIIVRIGP